MKKLLTVAIIAIGFTTAKAQHIEVGAQGGFGTTWLLNNNVSDQDDQLDYAASFGPLFGIYGAYVFPSGFGVVAELDYAMDKQKYTGKSNTETYEGTDKVNYFELPILIRKYSKGGFYFEVGPKFSFLTGAKETTETTPKSPFDRNDQVVKDGYKKVVVSAAFGIGGHFALSKNLYANAGLRFAYGFTDATVKFSETDLNNKFAAGDISIGTAYAHTDQKGDYSYKGTHLATGHVLVGISYEIPMGEKGAKKGK